MTTCHYGACDDNNRIAVAQLQNSITQRQRTLDGESEGGEGGAGDGVLFGMENVEA